MNDCPEKTELLSSLLAEEHNRLLKAREWGEQLAEQNEALHKEIKALKEKLKQPSKQVQNRNPHKLCTIHTYRKLSNCP